MAVLLAIGLILAAASTLVLAQAIGTILHISAVAGAVISAGLLLRYLERENPLDFEGEILGLLNYVFISGGTGFLLYKVFEAVIAASSGIVALVAIGAVALFFVNPSLLFTLIQLLVGGVVDAFAGE